MAPNKQNQKAPQGKQNVKAAPAKKAAPPAPAVGSQIGIASRPFDLVFSAAYLVFAAVQLVVFVSRCKTLLGKEYKDMCQSHDSLALFTDVVETWGDKVFSIQVTSAITMANRVNVFCLAPLSIFLSLGFFFGWKATKNFAMIHSATMLYSMYVMFTAGSEALASPAHSFGGLHGVDGWTLFASVIGFFLFFPIAVVGRVWADEPFKVSGKKGNCLTCLVSCIIKLCIIVWFCATILACYEFAVKHSAKGKELPSVVDATCQTWETVSPQVQEYAEVYGKQAQVYGQQAAEKGFELFEQAREALNDAMNPKEGGKK